ncbi:hypothetical protein DFJ73DRAFT_108329 [Zopfochytrium polystomum]|nr:hypothetical protein DFJ73DRAFT_108329 [Zopfochytrium polystomum]
MMGQRNFDGGCTDADPETDTIAPVAPSTHAAIAQNAPSPSGEDHNGDDNDDDDDDSWTDIPRFSNGGSGLDTRSLYADDEDDDGFDNDDMPAFGYQQLPDEPADLEHDIEGEESKNGPVVAMPVDTPSDQEGPIQDESGPSGPRIEIAPDFLIPEDDLTKIKSVMAGFQLPLSSIPGEQGRYISYHWLITNQVDWAKVVPESKWLPKVEVIKSNSPNSPGSPTSS